MFYAKPALSYRQQMALQTGRGLDCGDQNRTVEGLEQIGYYRLSDLALGFRIS